MPMGIGFIESHTFKFLAMFRTNFIEKIITISGGKPRRFEVPRYD
jgi:hypothetical protein